MGQLINEASGFLGHDKVGEVDSGRPVVVGTERDLPGLTGIDLTVIVDADGPLLAPHYRAAEDGLRLLARAVLAAGTGRGDGGRSSRPPTRTARPSRPCCGAIPSRCWKSHLAERAALGLPPGGELLVVEADDLPDGADAGAPGGGGGPGRRPRPRRGPGTDPLAGAGPRPAQCPHRPARAWSTNGGSAAPGSASTPTRSTCSGPRALIM